VLLVQTVGAVGVIITNNSECVLEAKNFGFHVSNIKTMTVGQKISLCDIQFFNWRTYNDSLYIRGICCQVIKICFIAVQKFWWPQYFNTFTASYLNTQGL
jgi:hypothetical protein